MNLVAADNEEWSELLDRFGIKDLARIYTESVEKHLPEIELSYSDAWEGGGVRSLGAASEIDEGSFGDLISHFDTAGIGNPVGFIEAHRKMIIADHLCSASFRQVGGIFEKDVPLNFVRGWAASQGLYHLIRLWIAAKYPADHDDGPDPVERRLSGQLDRAFPRSFNYDRPSLYEGTGTMSWVDADGVINPGISLDTTIADAINLAVA